MRLICAQATADRISFSLRSVLKIIVTFFWSVFSSPEPSSMKVTVVLPSRDRDQQP